MAELANYHHFDGMPWATGYLVNALAYQGVTAPHTGQPYTEALLMGINGGLCAGYFSFEYTGELPHFHFLTRYLFDEEPGKVFERLGIPMRMQQTTDGTKAAVSGTLLASMNTASEYGFGAVIAILPGFLIVANALGAIPNPLVNEAITVTSLAGITGSASGGMSIALAAMSETSKCL